MNQRELKELLDDASITIHDALSRLQANPPKRWSADKREKVLEGLVGADVSLETALETWDA